MNNFLDKMTNFIDSKLTPPLIKFGNNKYMVAIRNALIRECKINCVSQGRAT